MFRAIEADGERIELTCNSATKLVYKQVFGRELQKDMSNIDFKKLKKASKEQKKYKELGENPEGHVDEVLDNGNEMLDVSSETTELVEVIIRLGFIMITQNKPFAEYWGKTTYDSYVEWRSNMKTSTLTSGAFVAGVMNLYRDEGRTNSIPKN